MPASKIWTVGAFVVGGILLFVVALFTIGDRRNLFARNFEAVAEFQTVSGLQAGAPVRVAGFGAGEVLSIAIPAGPEQPFRVRFRLREDLRQLVRIDSTAAIQTDGIIGNKIIQIDGGTTAAPVVGDGGLIRSRDPLDLEDMMQRASATVDMLAESVVLVRGDVIEALDAVTDLVADANVIINDVGEQVTTIAHQGNRIGRDMEQIVSSVRQGEGTVGRLLNDDQLYKQATAVAGDVEKSVANLRATTEQVRTLVTQLREGGAEGVGGGIGDDVRRTVSHAEQAVRGLADTTEALKHHFLVRGFFTRRGFFDMGEIPEQQYRLGQLELGGRTPLRLWIAREYLFEEVRGTLRLTEAGRARIDSAMSEVLKYPPQTPLMVEGYAPGPTRDVRHRRSQEQAQQVLAYIQGRYARNASITAAIALGPEPVGDPPEDVDTWDGVAITMYVAFEAPATD